MKLDCENSASPTQMWGLTWPQLDLPKLTHYLTPGIVLQFERNDI
jgi:hypothetical protein